MAFDAFISYSHAADGRLAPALQRAIQRLAKPWYRARASGTSLPLIAFNAPGSIGGATPPSGFVQFAASGRQLLTSGYRLDRAALLWSLVPSDWASAACQTAGRNLSRTEWTELVGNDVPYHRTCPQWPAGG